MKFYKLVCEYLPAGNIANHFKENVPRPIQQAHVTELKYDKLEDEVDFSSFEQEKEDL